MNAFAPFAALSLLAWMPQAAGQQPAAPPTMTVQQQFDAASAALEAENWAEALRLFELLEARLQTGNPRSLAITRTRKGAVLFELGRIEEADQALRNGLPGLPSGDETLQEDRYHALLTLARIAEHALHYQEAQQRYRTAAAVPLPEFDKLAAYRGLVQTKLFDDPEAALADADRALAVIAAAAPEDRQIEGQFHTLKGRALLNLGRFREARAELEHAMRQLGNLTLRVDRADLVARSDLAIAALLAGDTQAAQRYLAYTGAGRFRRGALGADAGNELPPCGPDLAPNDVAIIEVSVLNDGTVGNVVPIYASRRGPSALTFARAVASWKFESERLEDIPPLLRSVARLELRCTHFAPERYPGADGRPPQWRERHSSLARSAVTPSGVPPLATLRRHLAALEGEPASADRADLLLSLGYHPGVPASESAAYLRRALPMMAASGAPPTAVARVALAIAPAERNAREGAGRRDPPDFLGLLSLPTVRDDPQVTALVRLAEGRRLYGDEQDLRAIALAQEVRRMPGIAPGSPADVQALELLAASHAARGEPEAARLARQAIGPGARACPIPARQRRSRASTHDFPNDALHWGFEGWAVQEALATEDGRPTDVRTVIGYPPFVFSEAGRTIGARSRYERSYLPDGGACPVARQQVRFVLP